MYSEERGDEKVRIEIGMKCYDTSIRRELFIMARGKVPGVEVRSFFVYFFGEDFVLDGLV